MGIFAKGTLLAMVALTAAACAGPTLPENKMDAGDPVARMLHVGLEQLNHDIDELSEHIRHLQQVPPSADPALQALHALNLAGWQLHQQQWLLQREHLVFAAEQIRRAQTNAPEKPRLWGQWTAHEKQFIKSVDELRAQQSTLEKKRFQLESQMLERYFR